MPPAAAGNRAFQIAFGLLAALVVTCLLTLARLGRPGTPQFAILHNRELYAWVTWFLLTPAIFAIARKAPFGEGSPFRWFLRHVVAGLVFGIASILIAGVLRKLAELAMRMPMPPAFDMTDPSTLTASLATSLIVYSLIAVAYQAASYHRAARERESVAESLRADLAEARLAIVEGQLHPHFLFNALNSIAALVRVDPRQAETMVEQLSDLLRATLRTNPMREVPLDEALKLAEQYLAIEQVRFGSRLRATLDATVAARRASVPQLILQPLVENAVRHGIASLERGGSVHVSATVQGERLVLNIDDDGVGLGQSPQRSGSGLGLSSVKSVLSHLYGSAQSFDIGARSPSGTRVTVSFPYRTAAS
jgi:two-component system LytT family sensor kinase